MSATFVCFQLNRSVLILLTGVPSDDESDIKLVEILDENIHTRTISEDLNIRMGILDPHNSGRIASIEICLQVLNEFLNEINHDWLLWDLTQN